MRTWNSGPLGKYRCMLRWGSMGGAVTDTAHAGRRLGPSSVREEGHAPLCLRDCGCRRDPLGDLLAEDGAQRPAQALAQVGRELLRVRIQRPRRRRRTHLLLPGRARPRLPLVRCPGSSAVRPVLGILAVRWHCLQRRDWQQRLLLVASEGCIPAADAGAAGGARLLLLLPGFPAPALVGLGDKPHGGARRARRKEAPGAHVQRRRALLFLADHLELRSRPPRTVKLMGSSKRLSQGPQKTRS